NEADVPDVRDPVYVEIGKTEEECAGDRQEEEDEEDEQSRKEEEIGSPRLPRLAELHPARHGRCRRYAFRRGFGGERGHVLIPVKLTDVGSRRSEVGRDGGHRFSDQTELYCLISDF